MFHAEQPRVRLQGRRGVQQGGVHFQILKGWRWSSQRIGFAGVLKVPEVVLAELPFSFDEQIYELDLVESFKTTTQLKLLVMMNSILVNGRMSDHRWS